MIKLTFILAVGKSAGCPCSRTDGEQCFVFPTPTWPQTPGNITGFQGKIVYLYCMASIKVMASLVEEVCFNICMTDYFIMQSFNQ